MTVDVLCTLSKVFVYPVSVYILYTLLLRFFKIFILFLIFYFIGKMGDLFIKEKKANTYKSDLSKRHL